MTSLTSGPWSLKKYIQNESSKLISVGTHNDYDGNDDDDVDSVTNSSQGVKIELLIAKKKTNPNLFA